MESIVKRFILVVALWIVVGLLQKMFLSPIIGAEVAVNQLQDSYSSSTNMTLYQTIKDYIWLVYILIPALVFIGPIKKAIKGGKK